MRAYYIIRYMNYIYIIIIMRLALSRSTDRSFVATDRRVVCVGARTVGTYGGQSLWKFFERKMFISQE